jgi:hypothetical protein
MSVVYVLNRMMDLWWQDDEDPSNTTKLKYTVQGVYKRMMRFQKFIKLLHSATGRCSPNFHRNVRELLNPVLQQRWIGRAVNGDNHIHILYGTNSIIVWMRVV